MLEISQQEIAKSLQRDNPWWSDKDFSEKQPAAHVRAYFKAFYTLALNWSVKRSTILLGPRRVGKTVMLLQLVQQALKDGFDPSCILFASIDTPLYGGTPFERLLTLFESQTNCPIDSRRIVIFDEVQYLRNWETHLKVLTDKFPNTKFIASGSSAAALRLQSQESGAGRFTEFFLPPLNFAEFLAFQGVEEKLLSPIDQSAPRRFETNDIAAINRHFIDYLNFGGYPETVLNPEIRGNAQRFMGRDIIDKVLLRDLPSLYGIDNIPELNRLFTMIAYNTGQEFSLDGLSKSSGVAKNTITKYLEYLEAAFLIVKVRKTDETAKSFQKERQFKLYLTNASMRAALFAPVDDDDPAMGAMAETALVGQWFHNSQFLKNIHYARWKKGRSEFEVDLVKRDPSRQRPAWAYEVKWSDRFALGNASELRGLVELARLHGPKNLPVGCTSKTLTTMTTVNDVPIRHFPCALHCYQIGRNLADGLPP
jgi:uncharacterized protein